jgi:prevent-host-death family protein
MAKEKKLPFVEARARLSEIVDQVAEQGATYVIARRQRPVAVIVGIDRYRERARFSRVPPRNFFIFFGPAAF